MRVLIAIFLFTVLGLWARSHEESAVDAATAHWTVDRTRADCLAILHGDQRV